MVDHLRWDLKQLFDITVAEGYLLRNPAQLLFTPRVCQRPATRIMTIEAVRKLLGHLHEHLPASLGFSVGEGKYTAFEGQLLTQALRA